MYCLQSNEQHAEQRDLFGENEALVMKIQQGNDDQADLLMQLYRRNSGMIEKIVRRYSGQEDPEDLRQESFFGLRQAALLWDPAGGASFIHYATYWIKQAIQRYIDDYGSVVRFPVHQRDRIRRYQKVIHDFQAMMGRDPSGRELQTALGLSPDQIQDVKRDAIALRIRSTSETLSEDGETTLEDTLPAEGDQIGDLLDRIQAEELANVLWNMVDELGNREAQILRDRYQHGKTLQECGEALGISTQGARDIEQKALRRLQRPSCKRKLLAFTEEAAYSLGLQHTSFSSFQHDHISSQERAIMFLEEAEAARRL